MGRYIADFCAPTEKLVVEIDGDIHKLAREYDHIRDSWMESVGYRTLRVTAHDVENDVEAVLRKIRTMLRKRT